jgi:single-stranded DNA-specific DHH superfamily exonuclease
MLKHVMKTAALGLMLLTAQWVQAASIADMQTSLMTARENLISMLAEQDKAKQEELKKKVDDASVNLEKDLASILADKTTPAATVTQLKAFEAKWVEFKATRDKELIPALLKGQLDQAKTLAKGIQADRFKQLKATLDELVAPAKK